MSFYVTSPFKATPKLMVQGTPEYMFGSFPTDVSPTQAYVLSNLAIATTATVNLKIYAGNVPLPGSLITIVGTANSGGVFNVTNAVILTVSAAQSPDQGWYQVTFAIPSTTQGLTTDAGLAIIPQPEVGDILTSAIISALPVSSAPVVSPAAGPNSVGKSLSATITLPPSSVAIPNTLSGVTVVLQGSNVDLDAEYNTVATIGTALAAGSYTQWQSGQGDTATGTLAAGSVDLINFRYYRFRVTAGSGTGPIVGKLMQ